MDRREAIEGAKEINKFLEEAAKKSDEKHQLSGETSIISEKHQLMLPLDDAVKVVGRICDEWWTLEDGDIEFIRNELEQKCYRIDQTTDCISRKQAINAVENTDIKITESEWDELISVINNLPPVTPINNIQKADTLIIATALRDFAQDSERKIPDRERAEELREQVLAYGASMCKPVTPTERTAEWTNTGVLTVHCSNCKSEFHELEAMNYCPNCGAKMKGGTENE